MTVLALTAAKIRALTENGAVIRPYDAGAAITVGQLVYVAADGDVEPADANVSALATMAIGIAVQSFDGETAIVANTPVSVCVFGPVSGFSSMTPGTNGYVSDTAGEVDDTAGTFDRIVGYAERTGVFFVNPEMNDPSSA